MSHGSTGRVPLLLRGQPESGRSSESLAVSEQQWLTGRRAGSTSTPVRQLPLLQRWPDWRKRRSVARTWGYEVGPAATVLVGWARESRLDSRRRKQSPDTEEEGRRGRKPILRSIISCGLSQCGPNSHRPFIPTHHSPPSCSAQGLGGRICTNCIKELQVSFTNCKQEQEMRWGGK